MMRGVVVLLFGFGFSSGRAEDEWPQFRGPEGQGHAAVTGLPVHWSETENVTWKTRIPGRGWSSPVIWNDEIWLTTAREIPATEEEKQEREAVASDPMYRYKVVGSITLHAICVDRRNGKIVHDIELARNDRPDLIHPMNSYASPTPVVEQGRIYCDFGTFGTACVATDSGEVVWSRCLLLEHNVGPGSSPVLFEHLLILVCDGVDQQYLTALDKQTGETVWITARPPLRSENGDEKKSFSTPLIIGVDGRKQLVSAGAQWVVSYDPYTGKELWRLDCGDGYSVVPRPVYGDGLVYICTGYGGDRLLAVRVDEEADVTQSHLVWEYRQQIPHKPSPLLVNGRLFLVSDGGVVSCLAADTGETIWRKRIGGNYSSSPWLAENRVYVSSHEGKTTVFVLGDAYHELAVNFLEGQIMASPAAVDQAIFLRTDTHLYRLESDVTKQNAITR